MKKETRKCKFCGGSMADRLPQAKFCTPIHEHYYHKCQYSGETWQETEKRLRARRRRLAQLKK